MWCSSCALDRIRNSVVNANEPEKDGGSDLAYGLYVLARNGAAPIGDLRYLADTKLDESGDPDRQGATGGGAGAGRRPHAGRAGLCRGARQPRASSRARLSAGSITARRCAMPRRWSRSPAKATRRGRPCTRRSQRVEAARGLTPYTSTQENAWLVLARARHGQGRRQGDARCRRRAGQDRALSQLSGPPN